MQNTRRRAPGIELVPGSPLTEGETVRIDNNDIIGLWITLLRRTFMKAGIPTPDATQTGQVTHTIARARKKQGQAE